MNHSLSKQIDAHVKNNKENLVFSCTFSSFKKELPLTVVCLCIGLALRLFYFIYYPIQPRDSFYYASIIRTWEIDGIIHDDITFFPLSLWILKIPYHIWNYDIIKGGLIINLIFGLFIIVVTTKMAYHFFNRNDTAFLAGLIMATHPTLIRLSCSFLRENTYLFFSLCFIYSLLLYCQKNRLFYLMVSGVAGTLAFLCRLEGLELFFFVLILHLFLYLYRTINFKQLVLRPIVFMIVSSVVILTVLLSLDFPIIRFLYITSRFDLDFIY